MTWREEIRTTAKFRGFTFNVRRHDAAGGRRLDIALAPFVEEPFIQDLGPVPQTFRLDGFILGDDYVRRRDNFLKILNEEGPGLLIHPWLGQHRVRVVRFSVRESQDQGRIAHFGIELLREGPPQRSARHVPGRTTRVSQVMAAADSVERVAVEQFTSSFVIEGVAGFVSAAAAEDVASFGERLIGSIRRMQGDTAKLLRTTRDLVDGAIDRISDPQGLAVDLVEAIRNVSAGIAGRREALRVLLKLAEKPASVDRGQSGQAGIAEDNARSTNGLLAGVALGEATRRAATGDWPSRQAAEEAKKRIVDAIERHGETVPARVFQELHALEAAVTAVLPGPRGELPDLQRIQLEDSEPALVVAYRLHGTPDSAQDLIDRNRVPHPMFVPAGEPLEVLANG